MVRSYIFTGNSSLTWANMLLCLFALLTYLYYRPTNERVLV